MNIGQYTFICRLNSRAALPAFKGSTFRGLFGHALKRVTCTLKHQACETCLLKEQCIYTFLFETDLTISGKGPGNTLNNLQKPYVMETPMTSRQVFDAADCLEFGLILFGRANAYLPYLVYAFKYLGELGIGKKMDGKRAGFTLETVRYQDQEIYRSDTDELLHVEPITLNIKTGNLASELETGNEVRLFLETPLRVKFNNSFAADLPFHVLIRTVLRRISSLEAQYGSGEVDIDYRRIVSLATKVATAENHLQWYDWKRYSSRQDQKMFMGGLIGSIRYQGDLSEFMPFLKYGQVVHIGKQTTFGLGKYRIV